VPGRAAPDGLWYEEGRLRGATRIHLSSGVSALEMLRIETDEAKEWSHHGLDLQETSELELYQKGL
jgi:hypothetical protein